jgi:hypothetical protein
VGSADYNSDATGVAVKDGAVTLTGNVLTHADKSHHWPVRTISVFPERTAVTPWPVEIQLP